MVTTASFAAATSPVSLVATSNFSSFVLTGPTTVCPSRSARSSGCVDVIAATESHCRFTSPAYSVLSSRVLASDFTIAPVSRSPFFRVTWSAFAAIAHTHAITSNRTLRRTVVLLYLFLYCGLVFFQARLASSGEITPQLTVRNSTLISNPRIRAARGKAPAFSLRRSHRVYFFHQGIRDLRSALVNSGRAPSACRCRCACTAAC